MALFTKRFLYSLLMGFMVKEGVPVGGPVPDINGAVADVEMKAASIGTLTHLRVARGLDEKSLQGYTKEQIDDFWKEANSQFVHRWGEIVTTYHAQNVLAASMRTERNWIFLQAPPSSLEDPMFAKAFGQIARLSHKIKEKCRGSAQDELVRRLFTASTAVIDLIDLIEPPIASEVREHTWNEILATFQKIEEDFFTEIQQTFTKYYFSGAFAAIAILSMIMLSFIILFRINNPSLDTIQLASASITFGALGGTTSIAVRFMNKKLNVESLLDDKSAAWTIAIMGSLRPVLGAIFGTLLFTSIVSGLAPILIPDDYSKRILFLASLSFFAGFGERFVSGVVGLPNDY